MAKRLHSIFASLLLLSGGQSAALADALPAVDLVQGVRALGRVQEVLTQGGQAGLEAQNRLMAQISAGFQMVPRERWRDRRQVLAATKFMLTGGRPDFAASEIVDLIPADLRDVWQGARHFARGDIGAARSSLAGVDPRAADPTIAGQLALVKGLLAAGSTPEKAIALFEDARLLGLGTLVEEAALRREIALLAPGKDQERFWSIADRYARRYAASVFARAFRVHFAEGLIVRSRNGDEGVQEKLSRVLRNITRALRPVYSVEIAEHAILKGSLELARFVTDELDVDDVSSAAMRDRARLFSAIVGVVGPEPTTARLALEAITELPRGSPEERLRAVALEVVGQIEAPLREAPAGTKPKLRAIELPGGRELDEAKSVLAEASGLLERNAKQP